MPVVSLTHFENNQYDVDKNAAVELLGTDGFRRTAVVTNYTAGLDVIYLGGTSVIADLKAKGSPLYPGQSYSTECQSALYAVADDAVVGNVDVRVMSEEEQRASWE